MLLLSLSTIIQEPLRHRVERVTSRVSSHVQSSARADPDARRADRGLAHVRSHTDTRSRSRLALAGWTPAPLPSAGRGAPDSTSARSRPGSSIDLSGSAAGRRVPRLSTLVCLMLCLRTARPSSRRDRTRERNRHTSRGNFPFSFLCLIGLPGRSYARGRCRMPRRAHTRVRVPDDAAARAAGPPLRAHCI